MKISSSAFSEGGEIPRKYTCDGEDAIVPLKFEDVPTGAKSLVLIIDDPDAPVGTWDHWILFNIPADAAGVEEGAGEPGWLHGNNSWNRTNWGGPCPPDKEHRYFFKLFALDIGLELAESASKGEVMQAMEGHVIEKAELMGRYKRPGM